MSNDYSYGRFDIEAFDWIMKDTELLLESTKSPLPLRAYRATKNFITDHSSSDKMPKRVLRRLAKTICYVGGALSLPILSGAAAQTPPENEVSELPYQAEMLPGDFRVIGGLHGFVYNGPGPFGWADVTIRGRSTGASNTSLDLQNGAHIGFGYETTDRFEDIDPDFILVNLGEGERNRSREFLLSPTLSSVMMDIILNSENLSYIDPEVTKVQEPNFKGLNRTEKRAERVRYANDLQIRSEYILKIAQVKSDVVKARETIDAIEMLAVESANMAARNKTGDALNYIISAEAVLGNEYNAFNRTPYTNSALFTHLRTVHDKGIASMKDEITSPVNHSLSFMPAKARLTTSLTNIEDTWLDSLEKDLDELLVMVQREAPPHELKNTTMRYMDSLFLNQAKLEPSVNMSLARFQDEASRIGSIPFYREAVVDWPPENETQEVSGAGVRRESPAMISLGLLGAGITAALLRKRLIRN